jgi:hypothetical protein
MKSMRNLMECVEYSTFTPEDERVFLKEAADPDFAKKFTNSSIRVMQGLLSYWRKNDPQADAKIDAKAEAAIQDATTKMRKLKMPEDKITAAIEQFNAIRAKPAAVNESFEAVAGVLIIGVCFVVSSFVLSILTTIVSEPFYMVDDLLTICGVDFPIFRWVGQASRFIFNKPLEFLQMLIQFPYGGFNVKSWNEWDTGSALLGRNDKVISGTVDRYHG